MGLCICLGENIVTYITESMPIFIRSADLSIDKNTGEQRFRLKCFDFFFFFEDS
jgi:hypothetical protein